jgi:myo-inositol-1-phosphate synthase
VEEDVVTPSSTTVVSDDGSWIGRTIVTLVILALLVAGAVWLVRTLSDNDVTGNTGNNGGDRQNEQTNQSNPDNTNTNPDGGNVQPSAVLPS